ncbi:hypothetical protein THRCLA_07447 [Thraustotheca clavata]|uniref:Uncharacterized protein n=1 Tax=Thraustotheca clavata TaxID=74557 RepID=A0A1V9ZDF7_9STRA|nr:hypothetical protein THRCLA_07447 [Thraustotheca clavata]
MVDVAPSSGLEVREALPSILEFYGNLLLYCIFLGLLYLFSVRCAERFEENPPKERPVLSTDLMQEIEDEPLKEEKIMEIDTDDMLKGLKPDGTKNEKANPAPNKQTGPFPEELNPLTYQPEKDEKVSFVDLHNAMLNRYKQKYPDHGPNVANKATDDDYDEEMKELMAKHLPEEFRNRRKKNT